jgi:RNA polymerase sigma-70 factor (ECF subfamily)
MQCEALPETRAGINTPECSREAYANNVDFSELLKSHWGQVFRICLRITRNEHDAEDAAQDCFLRAFSHLHQFQGKAQISTWLCSIARNCSLMLLRNRRTRQEAQIENSPSSNGSLPFIDPPDSRPDQLSRVSHAESCELLAKSIAALPIRLRTVADLFILNELTVREVAQILDLSNSSVKSRLFRARRRLSRIDKRCLNANIRSSHLNQQSRQASRPAFPIARAAVRSWANPRRRTA